MEKLANDYSLEMGRLEDFLNQTGGLLNTLDLDDEAAAMKAIEKINQWERESAATTPLLEHTSNASTAGKNGSVVEQIVNQRLEI